MAKERIRKSRRVSRMLKQRHDMGEAKFHEMMKHYVIRKCKNKHPVNWERVVNHWAWSGTPFPCGYPYIYQYNQLLNLLTKKK